MDKQQEEKLRAEFEKQIRDDLLFDDEELEWQPERNCYAIYGVHLAWWGYRASRVNLVVDIDWPEANDDHWKSGEEGAYAQGYEMGKDLTAVKVRNALRSIGLSIKEE